MADVEVIHSLLTVIGGLVTLLIAVLGYVGSRIHDRLDEISKTLTGIERDIRDEIAHLDSRVTRVEVVMQQSQK